MNKMELIVKLAEKNNCTKKIADDFLSNLESIIKESLINGEDARFGNLGTFKKLKRNERVGRNPQTNMEMIIPAKNIAVFRPSKMISEELNKK